MSINNCVFLGRLTKDPDIRSTTSQLAVCSFTIAVERKFKGSDGRYQADFIPCVAWRQTADFVAKYFRKGSKISVVGSMQSRNWTDQEGKKHNIMECVVSDVGFVEKNSNNQSEPAAYAAPAEPEYAAPVAAAAADPGEGFKAGKSDSFFPGPDDDEAVLPFDI